MPKKKQVSEAAKGHRCWHAGCSNLHKSTTGYCHEHAADIDKQKYTERKIRNQPLLWEERLDLGTTPAVTIK